MRRSKKEGRGGVGKEKEGGRRGRERENRALTRKLSLCDEHIQPAVVTSAAPEDKA